MSIVKKKFYETNSFKKLNAEWEKKLKKSGFVDIETKSELESGIVAKQQVKVDHERVVYFEQCATYLHKTKFEDSLDRVIFELHCEGHSNVRISEILKEKKLKALDRSSVDRRILAILKKAGITPVSFNF
jgi:hypothetical protein